MPFFFFPLGGDSSGGDSGGETLEAKLSRVEAESQAGKQATQIMNRLMADPEVRAVIQAKQQGQQIKVLPLEEYTTLSSRKQTDPADTGGDGDVIQNDPFAGLEDDQRTLASTISKAVLGTLMKQQEGLLQKHLEPVRGITESLHRKAQEQEMATQKQQIDSARKKYRDFDTLIPTLAELAKKMPELNAEELYILHKHRTGSPVERAVQFESEKGSSQPERPNIAATRKNPLPRGQAGFSQALEEAQAAISERDRTIS